VGKLLEKNGRYTIFKQAILLWVQVVADKRKVDTTSFEPQNGP
jgi:hypothetical protein